MALRREPPLTAKEKDCDAYRNGVKDCQRLVQLGFSYFFIHQIKDAHFHRKIDKRDEEGLFTEGFNDELDRMKELGIIHEAVEAVRVFTKQKLAKKPPKKKKR